MKQIEELSADNTFEELRQEIVERRKMQSDMLGWLYPSILEGEIDKIYDMIDEKSRKGQLKSVIIDPISVFRPTKEETHSDGLLDEEDNK